MDHNYPTQVLPITNYSLGKIKAAAGEGKEDNLPETQKKPGIGEHSILVKRQAFYFLIIF